MSIWHRVTHWLGWNFGTVETWWTHGPLEHHENRLMVGFRCAGCGQLRGVREDVDGGDP